MLSRTDWIVSILLPAALLTILLVGASFFFWQKTFETREAPLRREIAQNFAEKWGRCDLAAKWDKDVPCQAP